MRLAIFVDTGWSIGQLYRSVAYYLGADLYEWSKPRGAYPVDMFEQYDRVLTMPMDGARELIDYYDVPRSKILLVLHAEHDLIQLFQQDSRINEYAGIGAVSDSLVCSALTLGLSRVPRVLRQGIDCSLYDMPLPTELRTVGYAANMSRMNQYGNVEIKRGELAKGAVEAAGLTFRAAQGLSRDQMPLFYKSVDALVMSSLQEGGAMPPYEAAAAGRLVIGTPVGDFPRLVNEGIGILAPLNDEDFVDFTTRTLQTFRTSTRVFTSRCADTKINIVTRRSWPFVIVDWRGFTGVGEDVVLGSGLVVERDDADPRVRPDGLALSLGA